MLSRRDKMISRFLKELASAVHECDVSAADVWQVLTEPRPTGYTIVGPIDAAAGTGWSKRATTLLDLHRRIQETPGPRSDQVNGQIRGRTGE